MVPIVALLKTEDKWIEVFEFTRFMVIPVRRVLIAACIMDWVTQVFVILALLSFVRNWFWFAAFLALITSGLDVYVNWYSYCNMNSLMDHAEDMYEDMTENDFVYVLHEAVGCSGWRMVNVRLLPTYVRPCASVLKGVFEDIMSTYGTWSMVLLGCILSELFFIVIELTCLDPFDWIFLRGRKLKDNN